MPNINSILPVLYDGNQPYHVEFDNLPLKNILLRIDLVNSQVDINTDIIRSSAGNCGTLSNRLSVSIDDDGKIKTASVDQSVHSIGAHNDGVYNGIEYVRMTKSERDKLSLVQSEANKLNIEVEDTISFDVADYVLIENGLVKLESSDTIAFQFVAPSTIKAHSLYSLETAHVHVYGLELGPNSDDEECEKYKTPVPYKPGSLRVYINGFRLSSEPQKILIGEDPSVGSSWQSLYIRNQNPSTGDFEINSCINTNLLVDFDRNLH
jgi:hypothetical protein